ncbi:MAG: hypothetical protein IPG74_10165 [Flavobacteriales bacterium]|nr:hypothetical protein [Flavobacteriales bacterium]
MRQLFKKVSAFAFAVGALLAALPLSAQVATNYNFSQTTGTYTPITGGTIVATQTSTSGATSMDDVNYTLPGGTIPFNFTYDGVVYTGLNINSNGYVTFGATLPAAGFPYGAISNTAAYSGAVAAFSRDLQAGFVATATRTLASPTLTLVSTTAGMSVGQAIFGTGIPAGATILSIGAGTVTMSANATSSGAAGTITATSGQIRYETLGSPGTQTFVVQWSGFKPFGTTLTTAHGVILNYQIRLNEVDNSIEIHYGTTSNGVATTILHRRLVCADPMPLSRPT